MAIQLQLTVNGADRLRRGLSNAPDSVASETRSAMTQSLVLLEADQRRNVAQDTRRLMGSISHRIEGGGANITGHVGPSARYAYWVEHGRRPGKQPPVQAVSGWARRHGIDPFLLARAIGRRGTRAQPFVLPSWTRNRNSILTIFRRIGVRVAARVVGGR